jgi:hypothetical protein
LRASTSHRSVNIDMSASSASIGSSSGARGHTHAQLNDDKAEKANRRKSAHFGPMTEDGPAVQAARALSGAGSMQLQASASTGSVGAGAAGGAGGAQQQQPGRRHVSAALQAQGRRKRLSAVNPDMPVITLEEKQGNFEEWMKLATDNVSATSWFVFLKG